MNIEDTKFLLKVLRITYRCTNDYVCVKINTYHFGNKYKTENEKKY